MHDLLVIGGGINGVGIARDAAGRGLNVVLCEKDDLANHTSSASSKMIHGGLRYLENYDFKLVRESLREREILLRAAPHIISPMRIVIPVLKGMRPAWMLRIGLFIYDNLAKRAILPGTKSIPLHRAAQGKPLKQMLSRAFEYSDCSVDDARLVILNAVDAAHHGAQIKTRTECRSLKRHNDHWAALLCNEDGSTNIVKARMVINAAGPWVEENLARIDGMKSKAGIRLVKGSHIVTRSLYDGTHSYLFQAADGRVIFVMPYQDEFTLIGTTEREWDLKNGPVTIADEEIEYLCHAINDYFKTPISPGSVIWSYAGVRPLYDDDAKSDSVVTRDYVFNLDGDGANAAPILSIFGGKLTTYRRLAEHAMQYIGRFFPTLGPAWTENAVLPGGDFAFDGRKDLTAAVRKKYPWLPTAQMNRMVTSYGTRIFQIIGEAKSINDLGRNFGAGLYDVEIQYLRRFEFAKSPDDILWRRTKLGLQLTQKEQQFMEEEWSQICT